MKIHQLPGKLLPAGDPHIYTLFHSLIDSSLESAETQTPLIIGPLRLIAGAAICGRKCDAFMFVLQVEEEGATYTVYVGSDAGEYKKIVKMLHEW